jgi:hypothetical protein
MGKKEKNHRKKVQARNLEIKSQIKKVEKARMDYFTEMIKKYQEEQNKEELVKTENLDITGAPMPTLTEIQGPQI